MRVRLLPYLLIALLLVVTLEPSLALGQAVTTVLVRVTDSHGAGVPGLQVTLRDQGGMQTLGTFPTDSSGTATFPALTVPAVRVSLQGTTPTGQPVTLGEVSFLDDDALLVQVDPHDPLVALVADAAGRIVIDPQDYAQEAPAGDEPAPSALIVVPTVTSALATTPHPATPKPLYPAWSWLDTMSLGIWLLLIVLGLISGVVMFTTHERRVP